VKCLTTTYFFEAVEMCRRILSPLCTCMVLVLIRYFFEAVEMYRRILFVGVLPLLSENTAQRAAIGMAFALVRTTRTK
jgi:hypothetical protein